jgi:hypothetical protein
MDIQDYRYTNAKNLSAVNKLIELKKVKSPWEVIDAVLAMWHKSCPSEYDSHLVALEFAKQTGKRTSVGNKQFSNVSMSKSGMLRRLLDIPVKVTYLIRRLYPDMPMDKKFFNQFAERYPKMVVSERV